MLGLTEKEILATARKKVDYPEESNLYWIAWMPIRQEKEKYFADTYINTKEWGIMHTYKEVNADGSEIPAKFLFGKFYPTIIAGPTLGTSPDSRCLMTKHAGSIALDIAGLKSQKSTEDYDYIISQSDEKERARIEKMKLFMRQTGND